MKFLKNLIKKSIKELEIKNYIHDNIEYEVCSSETMSGMFLDWKKDLPFEEIFLFGALQIK